MDAGLFDKEGYLRDHTAWDEALANQIATADGITLTPAHWEILHAIRRFYAQYELSPATRPLLKYLGRELGPGKAGSIYVMQLFPGTPAKTIAKIAGLPKPANCI
ncbi:MAG: TusE/DsrC/DsvC family sulfur relay protein [bacterium]|nr:TusE/DsrC/DsvC family sulfur relay protein [bacterium]